MRLKRPKLAAAAALLLAALSATVLKAALPDTRTISFYNIHNNETITVEYKKSGK